MAKRPVVEIQCSRCDRKEYRESPPPEEPVVIPRPPQPAFQARLASVDPNATGPTVVSFDDLCEPCTNTVAGHLAAIGKKIEGNSPMREKKPPKEKAPREEKVQVMNGTGAKKKDPHAPTA